MPDLLLELRSEEIPARMQRKAAGDLRKQARAGLDPVAERRRQADQLIALLEAA